MKLVKSLLAIAAAAVMLVSCTDDARETMEYDAYAQADKIETALCEASLLLNPNFYYDSVEAVAWLMNYCLHSHVADLTNVQTYLGELMTSWTTSTETESFKTITAIYQFSDVKGHFTFIPAEGSGLATWTIEDADDLQITWPCEDALAATLTVNVADSSTKILVDADDEESYSESVYMVLPKKITAKLEKGGRTIATAKLAASYKIANDNKIVDGDHLSFSLALNVEDYKASISRVFVSTDSAKASAKISRDGETIFEASASLKDIEFDSETQELNSYGLVSFDVDIMGEVQVSGDIDTAVLLACEAAEDEATSKADLESIAETYNKCMNIVFYYDNFDTPQARFRAVVENAGGEDYYIYQGVYTYDGAEIDINSDRYDYCMRALLRTFLYIGDYDCPVCAAEE